MAHDWGGAIGMGRPWPRPTVHPVRADEHGGVLMPHCPWPIHLCHLPGFGPLVVQGLNLFVRTALRTTVCNHERMTPAVKAGYLAPYDSWAIAWPFSVVLEFP